MGDYTNARDCEHGRLRGSGRICAAEADYAALLARHNALVEATKSVLKWEYIKLVTEDHIDGDGLCRSLDALAALVEEAKKND